LVSSAIYFFLLVTLPIQHFGDTSYYVSDIKKYAETGDPALLWEAGHLLWRPMGYAAAFASGYITQRPFEDSHIVSVLTALNGVLGWLFVTCTYLIARQFTSQLLSSSVAIGMVITNAFLNYAQSGCSYIPGLAFLAMAAYTAIKDPEKSSLLDTLAFAFFLALSVVFWLPYVLVLPSLAILFGLRRHKPGAYVCGILQTLAASVVLISCAYLVALWSADISSLSQATEWLRASSHGITHERGVQRAVFGLARSFVYLGDDGNLFKRFLLRDPFNPVSFLELARTSLIRFVIFYMWLAVLLYAIWRCTTNDMRISALFAIGCVLGFAIYWQGGDLERYFPVFPLLAAATAATLRHDGKSKRLLITVHIAFVMMLTVSNIILRTIELNDLQEKLQNRVRTVSHLLVSGQIQPGDLMILATPHDELFHVRSNFRDTQLSVLKLTHPVWVGHRDAPKWRSQLSRQIFGIWQQESQVWVSKRLLLEKPKASWKWVEGDDPRVSWKDIHSFFASLQYGKVIGDEDGFCLLSRTPTNEHLLKRWEK